MQLYTDINHHYYGNFRVITHDKGISHWVIKGYIWEQNIRDIIFKYIKHDTTIIDIGANMGTHTVSIINELNRRGQTAKIVAFEPQPFIFSVLTENIRSKNANNITDLHSCGLSNRKTVIFMDMPDYSCTDNPGGVGMLFNTVPDHTKTRVEIETLDSFNYENVSFMKIDVEGHENEVLDGAKQTILKSKPVIIVEILGGVLLETATPDQLIYINNTIQHIKDFGYSVTLIACSDYLCLPL